MGKDIIEFDKVIDLDCALIDEDSRSFWRLASFVGISDHFLEVLFQFWLDCEMVEGVLFWSENSILT